MAQGMRHKERGALIRRHSGVHGRLRTIGLDHQGNSATASARSNPRLRLRDPFALLTVISRCTLLQRGSGHIHRLLPQGKGLMFRESLPPRSGRLRGHQTR
jgi:hypothetical protein